MGYREETSFTQRRNEAQRVMSKYDARIPVIVEPANSSAPKIDRRKYVIPRDMTAQQLVMVIRRRLQFKPQDALFMHVNGRLMNGTRELGSIYEENKDDDNFLYVSYALENAFG